MSGTHLGVSFPPIFIQTHPLAKSVSKPHKPLGVLSPQTSIIVKQNFSKGILDTKQKNLIHLGLKKVLNIENKSLRHLVFLKLYHQRR